MLEKQKEWCQEKIKKGEEFVGKHEFEIGIFAGGIACITGIIISNKIFEPKKAGISVVSIKDKSWTDDCVRIETYGINRFGQKTAGCAVGFTKNDASDVVNMITKIIEDTKKEDNDK